MSASATQIGHKERRKKIETTAAKDNGLPIAMQGRPKTVGISQ